jgi:hypothetical protein
VPADAVGLLFAALAPDAADRGEDRCGGGWQGGQLF